MEASLIELKTLGLDYSSARGDFLLRDHLPEIDVKNAHEMLALLAHFAHQQCEFPSWMNLESFLGHLASTSTDPYGPHRQIVHGQAEVFLMILGDEGREAFQICWHAYKAREHVLARAAQLRKERRDDTKKRSKDNRPNWK